MKRVQSLEPARYRLAAAGLRQGAFVAVEVGLGVEQHAARLLAVTASAADLLNVAIHGERQTGVNDEPHIRLVDAETERIGRNHDRLFAAHERLLCRLALGVLHLAVVLADRVVARLEPLAQPLDELHGRAVDDDGAMLVPLAQLALDRLEQRVLNRLAALAIARLAAAVDALDVQAQVVAAHGRAEQRSVVDVQRLADAGDVFAGGGGRQRNDLRVKGERVNEAADLAVGLAEVIFGLRQDVRLVHRDTGEDGTALERFGNRRAAELLGRKVEQAAVLGHVLQHVAVLGRGQVAVQHSGTDALAAERLHLVELERLERRDDERQAAGLHHGRKLIEQRLAAGRRHQNDDILVVQDCLHRGLLLGTQVCDPQLFHALLTEFLSINSHYI